MTLIGLGLSGFTRRLSIPDVELPFSSNTRRRGNASISLPSSSSSTSSSSTSSSSASESSHTHTSSTSSWIRPSLVPLLGKKYKDDDNYDEYNEDEDEEKYDFFVQSRKRRHHRRSSSSSSFSSFSISNLSYQSKTYLIALLYLFLFGLVLITYIAQNGIQSTINAREALARIQQTLGGRNSNNNSGQSSMNQLAEPKTITTKNRPKMKMVWSDDNKYNTTLPKPFDGFRWTFLHANIMPGEMTINGTISEKLEMLTFVEAIPPKRQIGWWQITLPRIPEVISSATCRFSNSKGDTITPAIMEWEFPRAPFQPEKRARWALLISCDIPYEHISTNSEGGSVSSSSFELVLVDEKTTFSQDMKLTPNIVPEKPEKGSLGICVAPLYGPLNELKILEWRLHHLDLGIKTVHWYDRDNRSKIREWLKELNKLYNLKDTFNEAPCISPETCGTEGLLEDKGVSGDQVLYYADCLARSRHTHPTEWLAMIDIDEFIFPSIESDQNNTITSFLARQESNIAALAIERFMAPSEPLLPILPNSSSSASSASNSKKTSQSSSSLMLDKVETLLTPQEIDRHDNTKMIYKSDLLKLAWVHWEVAFRSSSADNQKQDSSLSSSTLKKRIEKLDDGLMIIHINKSKGRGPFNTKFIVRDKFYKHVQNVREGYRKMMVRLPWLGSS